MTRIAAAPRWFAARWRQSLVFSFTVVGVLAVAAMAVVISHVISSQIRQDALLRARLTAETLARSSFAPQLPRHGGRLSRTALRGLDAQLEAARASAPGTAAVLRDGSGRVLYASRGTDAATAAQATGTHVTGRGAGRTVRTVLPVRPLGGGPAQATLQMDVPYGPVAHDIRARTRRLDLVLALTALAIYLLALPSVVRAGRAVRAQYDPRRIELARDVKRAIQREELSLAYQPIVDVSTGELRSVEALVRWTDPRRGAVSPAVFIPPLETTDAIWDLSLHVFDMAFAQCARWCGEGRRIRIAVNVSGAVLLDKRLLGTLRRLTRQYRVPAAMIELEITEGALVKDPHEATRVLNEIEAIGLSVIAIDDFGTGYSSLARLHELPLHTLKIDQSFVRRMSSSGEMAIVRSVVDLAHALNLDVIAEGVEDEATANQLRELGTEYIQGYYLSRPVPAHEMIEWLDAAPAVAR